MNRVSFYCSVFFILLFSPVHADTYENAITESSTETSTQTSSTNSQLTHKKYVYIALIIDDMGYKEIMDHRAMSLNANVSYAIMPFAPYSQQLAMLANSRQREVLLHLPMQSSSGAYLGPGGITLEMSPAEIAKSVEKSILSIPFVRGVNNHMGSLLTTNKFAMQTIMPLIKKHQLFFVDSRTSADSVAEKTAQIFNIPNATRDVFLDHSHKEKDILFQFNRLVELAKKNGTALGIAHPFKESLAFLEQNLPQLKQIGVKMVSVSKLISLQKQIKKDE